MTYVKASIFTTFLLICGLLGFIFYTFNGDYQLKKALEGFLREDYAKSWELLNELEGVVESDQLSLCRAYVCRERDDLASSISYLEDAWHHVKQGNKTLRLEIALNRAANAALMGDKEAKESMLPSLEEAQKLAKNQEFTLLLSGQQKYLAKDYAAALSWWSLPASGEDFLSPWMKKSFGHVFTPSWKAIRLAHCQIEDGDYLVARRLLEEETTMFGSEDLIDAWFLIGLSHMREAKDRPLSAAMSYYQMALSYFDRVPMQHDRFAGEKREVIKSLQEIAEEMVGAAQYEELVAVAVALRNWDAEAEVHAIAEQACEKGLEAIEEDSIQDLTAVLDRLVGDTEFGEVIVGRVEEKIDEALERGDTGKFSHYWEMARQLTADPIALAKKWTEKVQDGVMSVVEDDNEVLLRVQSYIAFWDVMERDNDRRLDFADFLLDLSGSLWMQEGQEQKGFRLMKRAEELPFFTEQVVLGKRIERALKALYQGAVVTEDIGKLPLLLEAVDYFHLDTCVLQDSAETANQVADAQYLYESRKYDEVGKRLALILIIDPENQKALRLNGLLSCRVGDYDEAFRLLKGIAKPDTEVREALATCEILVGDKELGLHLLSFLEQERSLSDETYLQLGYGLLFQDDAAHAMSKLQKVLDPDSSAMAAICYAAYRLGDWTLATQTFQKLPASYREERGMQLIVAQSLAEMGQVERAKKLFDHLFELKDSSLQPVFAPLFCRLKEQKLDRIDARLAVGCFYYEVLGDYALALDHLSQVREETPLSLAMRGQVYAILERFDEAEKDLIQVIAGEDDEARAQATRTLAEVYSAQRQDYRAIEMYREYFDLAPESLALDCRNAYAQLWIRQGRWDFAAQELGKLREAGQLSAEDKSVYVQSLIGSARFDEAERYLKRWLVPSKDSIEAYQLRLAKLALITETDDLVECTLDRIEEQKLSLEGKEALLEFLMARSDYKRAEEVAESMSAHLQSSVLGMMQLAQLRHCLSDEEEALAWARRASELEVNHPEVENFLLRYERDSDWVEGHLDDYRQLRERSEGDLSLELGCARSLVHAALATREMVHCREAQEVLEEVIRCSKELPEAYLLLGRVLLMRDDVADAAGAFRDALELNPSSIEARLYLAEAEAVEGEEVIDILESALAYSPNDSAIWKALAQHYEKNGELLKAKRCYQTIVTLRPYDSLAYFALGQVLMNLQNPEDAKSILGHATDLAPDNEEALALFFECLCDETVNNPRSTEKQIVYEKLYQLNPGRADDLVQRLTRSAVQ